MSGVITDFEKTLKRNRQNITAARRKVFISLQKSNPLTMAELVAACRPEINRSSVYRTIELFDKLGIISRIQIGWKYKLELSEPYQQHHHHLYCIRCMHTFALPEDFILEQRLHSLATDASFTPISHQIEISGICGTCAKPEELKRPG